MVKKSLALLLALVMTMSLSISAFAVEPEAAAAPAPVKVAVVGGENETMSRNAKFSISFTNLGNNGCVVYAGTFNLDGSEKLSYSASWSPTAQEIKVGVHKVNTYSDYYTVVITGGDASGTIRLSQLGVTAGEYEVVVINPYGATYNVSGNVNFEWK